MLSRTGPVSRDLVLVGGGHSHVAVLKSFGMRPQAGTRITMISRDVLTPYSGMLPGLLAGHYDRSESHVDLQPLCAFAGARLYHSAVTGLDLAGRQVLCAGRPPVGFDVLSIDTGSAPSTQGIAGAAEHALAVKPVDRFLRDWQRIEQAVLAAAGRFHIAVVGAGAGGVELSLSLQYRLRQKLAAAGVGSDALKFSLITMDEAPLPRHGPAVQAKMQRTLAARGIALLTLRRVTGIERGAVLWDGGALGCDATILVTHAGPPAWLRSTGLALDESGFIQVAADLQSTSHPGIFAAGDVAAIVGLRLEKSGVYAVRQGPVLTDNLRAALLGAKLRPYRPQRRTLALISTGDANAVASYGPLAVEGPAVWRFKDWIDRRWMRQYQVLPEMPAVAAAAGDDTTMRCGGCGAKVPNALLQRALARLPKNARADVLIGLEAPDDAAVLQVPAGKLLVQTVDHFRPFIDDPYLFGRVTANHCLGDIFAMGATAETALAMVTLPYGPEAKAEETLYQLLAGAVETLQAAGASLIGGHTGEGPELAFGLSVTGYVDADRLLRKSGMRPGDALILTKPLGTGVIFAAAMRGKASSSMVDAALAAMLQSSRDVAASLSRHHATACTDVTGFGLLGHLLEMLRAAAIGAVLDLDALPPLPGAVALLQAGIASTMQPSNERFAAALSSGARQHAAYPLLFDPQTAGGMLASLPRERAADCLRTLAAAGHTEAAVIGHARAVEPGQPLVLLR